VVSPNDYSLPVDVSAPTVGGHPALPEVTVLIATSRLRPGLDGGYTVATMQRAALLARAGLPIVLLTVDLHPDYEPFLDEFRRLGLAGDRTVMRNLLGEVRARPELLRQSADETLVSTTDAAAPSFENLDIASHHTATHDTATHDMANRDAAGLPWRQVVRDVAGQIIYTDFFDSAGKPLFRLPYLTQADWWRAPVVIDVFDADGERLGGLPGFGGLYRAWWAAVIAEITEAQPGQPVVAIAEARQVGELLIGTPGLRVVHTVHSAHTLPPHAWDSPVDAVWGGWLDTLPGYDAVVWLTHRQRADVAKLRGGEEAPGWVIPHPAHDASDDSRNLEPMSSPTRRDPQRAVMVSRLAPVKRVDHAIRAWRQVVEVLPDARLDIYGDGPLRSELQTLIDSYRLGNRVTLHGYDSDAPEQTRTAACLLMTSVYEGQSLAIAEAMARGCPAVSYDIAYGPAEMIVDGESGLLVRPGDIDALAEAIISLLGDEEKIARFELASLAWASSAGPERALESWRDLLSTVIAAPAPLPPPAPAATSPSAKQ
jgi:poly(glycerol-phosphate) alpha-glucosyltransferase